MTRRLVAGYDSETTGLEFKEGHRIIEVAFCIHDLDTGEHVANIAKRFNPRHPISPKAQAVHGISLDMLVAEPLFETEAPGMAKLFNTLSLIVAHNGQGFDKPFLENEMRICGVPLPEIPWYDTMLGAPWATEDGKRPSLRELAFSLGFTYDEEKAHGALYDTQLMMECFFAARRRYGLFQTLYD